MSNAAKHAQDQIGFMVIRFSVVEMLINEFITSHYIKEPTDAMNFYAEVITQPNFGFELKYKILKRILDIYYPNITKTFPYNHLRKVRDYRNIFAHSGVKAPDLESLNDLNKLTLSSGRKSYPFMEINKEFLESQDIVVKALKELPGVNAEELISSHYDDAMAAKKAQINQGS